MKNLLKYLIPIIFAAVALIGCAEKSGSTITESQGSALSSEAEVQCSETSESHSKLHLACQTFCTNVLCKQSLSKRTSHAKRNSFEVVKAFKAVNASIKHLIRKESLTIHPSFADPGCMLHRLGRLII